MGLRQERMRARYRHNRTAPASQFRKPVPVANVLTRSSPLLVVDCLFILLLHISGVATDQHPHHHG